MKKLLGCLSLLPLSLALVVACSSACSSSSEGEAQTDAGASSGLPESGGTSGASGTSGTSGTSGASGTSGTSGTSGDGGGDGGPIGPQETACDPATTGCKTGEVCTDISRDAHVCRPGCKNDAECTGTPKSGCVLLTPGSAATGACIPTCTPFGTDCAAGYTCTRVPEQTGVAQTSKAAYCRKTGATPLGGNCVNDPASCGANAECIFFPAPPQNEDVDDSRCHTLCDAMHPCGAGKGDCFTNGSSFGFCSQG